MSDSQSPTEAQPQVAYGIKYTPADADLAFEAPTWTGLAAWNDTRFIRLTWVDISSVIRCKVLTLKHFRTLASKSPNGVPTTTLATASLGLVGRTLVDGFSVAGDYLFEVDLSSLRLLPCTPGHAIVFGWLKPVNIGPVPQLADPFCPRTILRNIIEEALARGLTFLVGFELEFTLLKDRNGTVVLDDHDWSTSSSIHSGAPLEILDAMVTALERGGIAVHSFRAEAGPGQYKIVTGPLQPLQAADALSFSRDVIRGTASGYQRRATFAPWIYGHKYGNGLHTHVSIHSPSASEGEISPLAPTLNPLEAIFLQSLLDNLGGICAFSMPTSLSYERTDEYIHGLGQQIWGPGKHVCWGTHHRQVPIRLCGPPGAHKFELRSVDATANPYLLLASIVAAAIEGVDNQMSLTTSDSTVLLGQNAKTVALIPDELPHSFQEAFRCLEEQDTMGKFFGECFIQAYRGVIEEVHQYLGSGGEGQFDKVVEMY
ncbi:glutamine synthetase guanido kinase [Thelephora ganbajun]|uniref:Glutamine synthetase guanido kinase n=1 Tax=Thelephora ganbajun TaxID=370292 RepID=A0ACB6ZKD2_THEGA|nr:glutamine synthetase guanido kinase [Thelephora ganbajun]